MFKNRQTQHGPRAVCCKFVQFPLRPLAHAGDLYRKRMNPRSLVTEIGQAAFQVKRGSRNQRTASGLACVREWNFLSLDA